MTANEHEPRELQPIAPLERARLVSQSLTDAARRARFSMRSRRRLQGGGFRARPGDELFEWARWITFWLMVTLPTATSALYFGFLASDQYVGEFKFTVAGAEPSPLDNLGIMTGIPDVSIIQNTQIVVNHLTSRAAIESLEQKIGIKAKYSAPSIDWWARFDATKPIEKLVRYWTSMTDASIKMPAGIVEIKIRAFTPEEALAISSAALSISEDLINELNERMNRDAIVTAESEVQRAKARLTKARIALETARNEEGLLDVQRAAEGVGQLLTETKSTLMQMQQEYNSQIKAVSEQAPQMKPLRTRINATKAQIAELEAKVTSSASAPLPEATLSKLMTRFSELDLEKQISERLYDSAITGLEAARLNAERKTMYLKPFVLPTLPEDATYPRRSLNVFLSLILCLAIWSSLLALTSVIRNNMA